MVLDKILCENKWLSLLVRRAPDEGFDEYVFSHETRCQGRIVAILPFRQDSGGTIEYLLRSEITPCWSLSHTMSAVTGGFEGGDIADDAVREMLEETGYAIDKSDLIPLGTSYASKSSDTVYTLFAVNLTGMEHGEAIGDGSSGEVDAETVWVFESAAAGCMDPQVPTMLMRLVRAIIVGMVRLR